MPLNTIRVDCCGYDPEVIRDHILDALFLVHDRKDALYEYKFYIQLEEGDETGKLHWQGWADHNAPVVGKKLSVDAFRERMNKHITAIGSEFKNSSSKSFAKIKDLTKIHSYHLKNPTKQIASENIYTNFTSEELASFWDNCPEWVPSKKKEVIKTDWFSLTFEELEGFAICTDITGVKRINYPVIPKFVLSRVPKNLDYIIFTRLVLGLTNRLESKYINKFNKRVQSNFLDKILCDYAEIFKLTNF